MNVVLGINAYHGDAAACLLIDGSVVAAAEEERFVRIKHWAGFPERAIEFCLSEGGVDISDVDVVAINSNPLSNVTRKMKHVMTHGAGLNVLRDRLTASKKRVSLRTTLNQSFSGRQFTGKIERVDHHLAHLASTFYASPYESAAVVSVDGFGDFASGCWGVGSGKGITVSDSIYYPHSLGIFYQAITQFLGFPNYGDEYKVMGLAPYGNPRFVDEVRRMVRLQKKGRYELNLKYFRHHKEKVEYTWDRGSPVVGDLFSSDLEELLGQRRSKEQSVTQAHKDIAASTQLVFEETLFHMLRFVREETGLESICLAGGCGNNSVANGKIRREVGFSNVYVAAASGDAGGAVGAAYQAFEKHKPKGFARDIGRTQMRHAYLGPSSTVDEIKDLLEQRSDALPDASFVCEEEGSVSVLTEKVARDIAGGAVVGWFQGRMEWGPRALGNRSILGDPRRADMKEILNVKIKRRESFRPFAPSILREFVSEWFEEDDEVPFMMKVLPIKNAKRALIPAVTHTDGSGRLQTVSEETNPKYHALISAFFRLTGVPLLLNTSFNENEPVVCQPSEALDCFLRTKMDVLVLENWIIKRRQ